MSEITLSYKSRVPASKKPKITCSKDAYDILYQHWDPEQIEFVEQFKVLFLNRANRVNGIYEVSKGATAGTVVDPKLVFVAALKVNSAGIILSHNHPSGNLKPSEADIQLTEKLKSAGKFLELPVLDHLIVTSEGYFSFADQGMM